MSHLDEGQLHALLDGELDETERKAVEAHLESCAECRREFAEARAFMAGADELIAAVEVPAGTRPAMVPLAKRSVFRWRTLAWAASLVLAVGLGWMARTPEVRLLDQPRATANDAGRMAPTVAVPDSAELKRETVLQSTPANEPAAGASALMSQKQAKPAAPPATAPARDEALADRADNAKSKEAAAQPTTAAERALTNPADKDALRPRDAVTTRQSLSENDLAARKANQPAVELAETNVTAGQRASEDSRSGFASPPAPALAAAPSAAPEESRRGAAFRTTPMEAAVRILGGSIRLVDGMTPTRVLVGAGNLVSAADPGLEVVRVVYNDPPGRELWLDQQRPQPAGADQEALGKVATTLLPGDTLVVTLPGGQKGLRWIHQTGFRLGLTGFLPADSLRALARRVQ